MSRSRALCCLPGLLTIEEPKNVTSIFLCSLYNKTIMKFGFCNIQNNQGLGKSYQPQPSPSDDIDYSGYHKNLIQ